MQHQEVEATSQAKRRKRHKYGTIRTSHKSKGHNMGKALEKFAKEKKDKISKAELNSTTVGHSILGGLPLIGNAAGLSRGNREGHKTAGLFLGPSGAAGAEAKDTGRSTLLPAMGGGAIGGAALGALIGSNNRIAGAIKGAAGGGAAGGVAYGLGHLFGKNYSKREKADYKK